MKVKKDEEGWLNSIVGSGSGPGNVAGSTLELWLCGKWVPLGKRWGNNF